jgi:hypothetical protein
MSTFIELTNKVLRRLNEVEILDNEFASVRGIQSIAKDSVRNAINKIDQAEFTWPYNAAETTQVLVKGQEEYSWPAFFKSADWESFQIQADPLLNIGFQKLDFISRDQYYQRYRDIDQNSGADGISIPRYVFPSHGNGFGVSPSPDAAYSLKFRYYLAPIELNAFNDSPRIPSVYDHVIVDGAMYYMYLFKENQESTQLAVAAFQEGLREMRAILINRYNRMYDTRVAF